MAALTKSWVSSVGIVMGYGLEGRDSIPDGNNIFSSPSPALRATRPLIQWVSRAISSGSKAAGA
jgi:hypothetical protein